MIKASCCVFCGQKTSKEILTFTNTEASIVCCKQSVILVLIILTIKWSPLIDIKKYDHLFPTFFLFKSGAIVFIKKQYIFSLQLNVQKVLIKNITIQWKVNIWIMVSRGNTCALLKYLGSIYSNDSLFPPFFFKLLRLCLHSSFLIKELFSLHNIFLQDIFFYRRDSINLGWSWTLNQVEYNLKIKDKFCMLENWQLHKW